MPRREQRVTLVVTFDPEKASGAPSGWDWSRVRLIQAGVSSVRVVHEGRVTDPDALTTRAVRR